MAEMDFGDPRSSCRLGGVSKNPDALARGFAPFLEDNRRRRRPSGRLVKHLFRETDRCGKALIGETCCIRANNSAREHSSHIEGVSTPWAQLMPRRCPKTCARAIAAATFRP
jgi:hypothetical protein